MTEFPTCFHLRVSLFSLSKWPRTSTVWHYQNLSWAGCQARANGWWVSLEIHCWRLAPDLEAMQNSQDDTIVLHDLKDHLLKTRIKYGPNWVDLAYGEQPAPGPRLRIPGCCPIAERCIVGPTAFFFLASVILNSRVVIYQMLTCFCLH